MRRPLIAGNWKMNLGGKDSLELVRSLKEIQSDVSDVDILICPPFTAIPLVYERIKDSRIKLGAQNCYYQLKGAFTGEISPLFLVEMGCEYVILGHSERRQYFGEKADLIAMKIKCALETGLDTILCVGEKLEERETGNANDVVNLQLEGSLNGISDERLSNITLAYEPVWAIGTGKTCDPDIAEDMHKFIRNWFKTKFGDEASDNLRILYGGSIKPENIISLMEMEDIDGGLVGGASLKVESFSQILKNTALVYHRT